VRAFICAATLTLAGVCSAATLYVDINSTNGTPPYATWETAATNIQDAVNITSEGDTVLVTNGVYNQGTANFSYFETNIVFVTNGITVRSVNGAEVTIIDGRGSVRCALLLATNSLLDGFTLVNGRSPYGGAGVDVWYGTVDHCIIVSNYAAASNGNSGGGAIVADGAKLLNSTVAWNSCTNMTDGAGGGISCFGYAAAITNCTIVFNTAVTYGGGILATSSSLVDSCYIAGNRLLSTVNFSGFGGGGLSCRGATIRGCTIANNTNATWGGGVLLDLSSTMTNCIVEHNEALRGGGVCVGSFGGAHMNVVANTLINANKASTYDGGVSQYSVDLTLNSCTISSNTAGNVGGGSASYLNDCSIFANSATGYTGGVFAYYLGSCTISNNTAGLDCGGVNVGYSMSNCVVIGNSAGGKGGGVVHIGGPSPSDCLNSLIVGNTSAVGGGVSGSLFTFLKSCTISGNHSATGGGVHGVSGTQVRNSIVYGNTALDGSNIVAAVTNITYSCVAPLVPGTNNVDTDPIFAGVSAGDYRLSWGSACIDSGTADTSMDLDGFARPLDGDGDTVAEYDMGAYEFGFDHSLADADGDAMNDSDEIGAGTNPTNPASVFAMENTAGDATGWVVTWSSVTNKLYDLYHSTNLLVGFVRIATNVPATAPQNVFTDLTAAADANYYQVRVGR